MQPAYDHAGVRIYQGDALTVLRELPGESVDCCVTSPPYYGLRDYGTGTWQGGDPGCEHQVRPRPAVEFSTLAGGKATTGHQQEGYHAVCGRCGAVRVDQQIGLEESPGAYVERLVEVFREVRRVLRPSGTIWVNMGDAYARSNQTGGRGSEGLAGGIGWQHSTMHNAKRGLGDLKPKDLRGLPWRLAFALQADGWWLRQEITWCKRAAMPESVTDRPTSATEKIFLLAKQARYYYDATAVAEPSVSDHPSGNGDRRSPRLTYEGRGQEEGWRPQPTRNLRNYLVLGPQSYAGCHFAVFPERIPEIAIMAGSSERGVCVRCGRPWRRVIVKLPHHHQREAAHQPGNSTTKVDSTGWQPTRASTDRWAPTCNCGTEETRPAVVLDPFLGSGTAAAVAKRLGRHAVGIELNPQYIDLAARRLEQNVLPLTLETLP